MKQILPLLLLLVMQINYSSGQMKARVDLILINGNIYTLDKDFKLAEAVAVNDGRIVATGSSKELLVKFQPIDVFDIHGRSVYPGFIDAHCHFYGYSLNMQQVELNGASSFDEVIDRLVDHSEEIPGEWLVGRGWDQNRWPVKKFPERSRLDSLFPDRPVVLIRIDGHTVLANGEALKRAGMDLKHSFKPGEVEVKNGRLTGILTENAADRMRAAIPEPRDEIKTRLLIKAQESCFASGLTMVADAGLDYRIVKFVDSLQQKGVLKMAVYAMLNPTEENIHLYVEKGKYRTPLLDVRSIKLYADGSLGSRTALLKQPYSDDPGKNGMMATSPEKIKEICTVAVRYGYQVNTHAIGDRAVRTVLDIYRPFLKGKNDRRWRIEHAQVVDPVDLPLFGQFSVIPSVQASQATSDMYWAGERLGKVRIRWAYAYKNLLKQNGWLANSTDFPIENINPLLTFYAAVARQDVKGYPASGFQIDNCLLREEALRSMTIWAAKACFEEDARGSIEPGKYADLVILDKDIMQIPYSEIPGVKVVSTFSRGEKVFDSEGPPDN